MLLTLFSPACLTQWRTSMVKRYFWSTLHWVGFYFSSEHSRQVPGELPVPAGRKKQHPASARCQPVCADAWTTAPTCTCKRQNLGAEAGVDFPYNAPCSHKTVLAKWKAPPARSFSPSFSNIVKIVMLPWCGGSALSYQATLSLWNNGVEPGGSVKSQILNHGVCNCISGYSLKQVDFSSSVVRRAFKMFYWLFFFFFLLCLTPFLHPLHPSNFTYKPSASEWGRSAKVESSQFARYYQNLVLGISGSRVRKRPK